MPNLQDILNIAKADGGKFFVMDETGETKLAILPIEEYEKLVSLKNQKQITDVDSVNEEILKATLESKNSVSEDQGFVPLRQILNTGIKPIKQKVSSDLRSEVIDPSFDFELTKNELEDF